MSERLRPLEPLERDYYDWDEVGGERGGGDDSDSSTDDEIQSAMRQMAGLPPQIPRPNQERIEARQAVADFEAAMDAQLTHAFHAANSSWLTPPSTLPQPNTQPSTAAPPSPAQAVTSKGEAATSVSERSEVSEKGLEKRMEEEVDPALGLGEERTESDEEADAASGLKWESDPLYDPSADAGDEAWVESRRGGKGSDASLACPACLTCLSRDCQRHAEFKHQYRALFVANCVVDASARVYCPSAAAKRAAKRARKGTLPQPDEEMEILKPNQLLPLTQTIPSGYSESDFFNPVNCAVCKTQVGFFEKQDELYHFNNVLASYG